MPESNLRTLLQAIGCNDELKPGGVNVFVTGAAAQNKKFISDCFRFAQVLFLLGRIAGLRKTWIAEMPGFALAMTANGIPYDLLKNQEFLVPSCREEFDTGGLDLPLLQRSGRLRFGGIRRIEMAQAGLLGEELPAFRLRAVSHDSLGTHQRPRKIFFRASRTSAQADLHASNSTPICFGCGSKLVTGRPC